jgi:hypothetical protein
MDILYWTSVGALAGATATAIIGGHLVKQSMDRKIRRLEGRIDATQMFANDRARADFRRITDLEQAAIRLHHELHTIKQHRLESWKEAGQ